MASDDEEEEEDDDEEESGDEEEDEEPEDDDEDDLMPAQGGPRGGAHICTLHQHTLTDGKPLLAGGLQTQANLWERSCCAVPTLQPVAQPRQLTSKPRTSLPVLTHELPQHFTVASRGPQSLAQNRDSTWYRGVAVVVVVEVMVWHHVDVSN